MTTVQRRQTRLFKLLLPIVAIGYLSYFGYWMFHGYYGVWAKAKLDKEAAQLRVELADLRDQQGALERRIALLRPESLDPDMVDERAREALNVMRPDELVIFTDTH